MREKGFTLFTALIAFILIILSLLLVQSMTSTETSVSTIVNDISEQQEMQAIADLTRADALQGFNFGIRYTIEQFSTDNAYILFEDGVENWDTIKKDFVKDRFGVFECGATNPDDCGIQFATQAAQHLIFILTNTSDARGFNINLEAPDLGTMEKILDATFDAQSGRDEFFEVVNCEDGVFQNCLGTFYVTLDLSPDSLSVEDYEKFPLVSVVNTTTQRSLKEPILPRGTFRIYVPIRLFKALAAARQVAKGSGSLRGLFDIPRDEFNTMIKGAAETKIRLELNLLISTNDDFVEETEDGSFKLLDDIRIIAQVSGEGDDRQINKFEVTLKFKETNPKYRVSEKEPNIYAITLTKIYN